MSRVLALGLVLVMSCNGGDAGEERLDAPGVEGTVELIGPPEEGAGPIPTFTWRPVEGAERYRLGVLTADGEALWAWEGVATSVVFGGVEGRPEGETGPVLAGDSTWSVIALDGRGGVVAVSDIRPVSP